MEKNTFVEIKLNSNAILRIKKDNIVATLSNANDKIDVFMAGRETPWHLQEINADSISKDIWGV